MPENHSLHTQGVSAAPILRTKDSCTVERFVAFLDIMGFKDRVARNSHKKVLRQLEAFQNLISSYVAAVRSSPVQVALFSDSVLLFSENGNMRSLKAIAEVSRKIMMSALQQDIPVPLKGAIAKGTVTCDAAKQLYFGQALIDAYMLEESVKYYGVLVHHTAEKDAKMLLGDCFRDVGAWLRCGKVSHYELNWYSVKTLSNTCKTVERCLENLRMTVSDEPRKYIDNTLSIFRSGNGNT